MSARSSSRFSFQPADVIAGGSICLYRNDQDRPFGEEDQHMLTEAWDSPTDIPDAYTRLEAAERRLAADHAFAWHPEFGYLSPFPEHCGTGIRIEAEVHLEGLHIIGDLPPVLSGLTALRIGYKSIDMDGLRNVAHLFRIFNESAIGLPERALIARVARAFTHLAEQETAARKALVDEQPRLFLDSVERALAILRHARLLSPYEYLDLLSPIRLAAIMGFLDGITRQQIDKVMRRQLSRPLTQPPATQEEERQRDIRDADLADRVNAAFADVRFNEFAKDILS
jgi:protein arginine kinase